MDCSVRSRVLVLASDEAKGGVQMARRNSEEREECIQLSYGENAETKDNFPVEGERTFFSGFGHIIQRAWVTLSIP